MRENTDEKSFGAVIADIVHLVVILTIFIFVARAIFSNDNKTFCIDINGIFSFIGAIAFVLFGIVGVYEYAYSNGITFLVPPTFTKIKESNSERQAERMMKEYYKEDMNFLQRYEKERVNHILQVMGISAMQFHHINYEIVKARVERSNYTDISKLRSQLKTFILRKEFIEDLTMEDCAIKDRGERLYEDADYFLNLYTALYDADLRKDVGKIMSYFIVNKLGEDVENLDYIIVPKRGNFLLGLELGKQLHKPVIAIHSKGRIWENVCWDGYYEPKFGRKNRIIVVHDVLVTGMAVIDSIGRLPKDTYDVIGVFSLAKYSGFGALKKMNGEELLRTHKIKTEFILDINQEMLKNILKDK